MRKAYKEYKATGIQWLPKIPKHWEYKKINSLFLERKTKVSDKDYQPLSVTKSGVLHQLTDAAKSNDSDNRKLVLTGDFVINSRSDRKGSCGVSALDGSVSLINIVLEPKRKLEQLFVHYLLRCQPFSEEYYRCGRGIVADLWTTRYSEMKSIYLPISPREEQEHIARFLDWKVSSINRLINLKQLEITQLKELKKATISDAVTHGLGKTVPMKDSGITWIGKIPRHWKIEKLKRVSKIRKQKSYYNKNKDIFISLENLKGYSNTLQETSTQYESSIQCVCKKADLLFGKLRPYLSKAIICPKDCFCTNELLVVSFFNGNIKFLMYVFLHESFIDSVNASTYGAKMPRANDQYILNMCIPVPPREEQAQIAHFLDVRCAEIDRLIDTNQAQITNLHDLKSSLIADVVTGQIDVRDVEIPDYEQVEETLDDTDTKDLFDNEEEVAEV